MVVKVSEMVRAVRRAIDANRSDAPLFSEGDVDTLSLDEIIRSKLVDAVRLVEMEAPLTMLESGHDFGGVSEAPEDKLLFSQYENSSDVEESPVFWNEDGKGFIILPDDFMRLVAFRMSDWKRTVFEPITDTDQEYKKQSSKWKGICGNTDKPVVAIVRRAEGKVLEFYSCKDNTATVVQAAYVPIPKIDQDGGIDIAEECYTAIVYRAASLALASVGDQLSKTMLEISKSYLQ